MKRGLRNRVAGSRGRSLRGPCTLLKSACPCRPPLVALSTLRHSPGADDRAVAKAIAGSDSPHGRKHS